MQLLFLWVAAVGHLIAKEVMLFKGHLSLIYLLVLLASLQISGTSQIKISIDSKALLNSWLQDNFKNRPKCFESMTIAAAKDNGRRQRRKGTRRDQKQQQTAEIDGSSNCCNCGHKRIAWHISEARRACRLALMIRASLVCYGVPSIIRKKSAL